MNRRSILKAAAWSVPAITIAKATPAFATSGTPSCTILGWHKDAGEGQADKDYYVVATCVDGDILSIHIYDDVNQVWRLAERLSDDTWVAYGFNDSRNKRRVKVNGSDEVLVSFPPKKE